MRQPERGSWHWSWRGQGFVEPNRALAKAALFPGRGGGTGRVNGIVAVARVAHRRVTAVDWSGAALGILAGSK
ncbi:MAG: hypothetical protein DMG43_13930 [Acidobacteria bacterium]|nr:MAG: hypothetical protein DMG43_13930 [Acidobacteriota bacterium]